MPERRPDPEVLLERLKAEEAKQRRGKLKIFFGAAPGVGKTYTMLEAARKVGKEGMDVVVGYVEPHSRPETQALVLGLDVLPRLEVNYHGVKLLEFHLEAALALHPQLLIVDELAHTNAPGMVHAKRWQDVMQLLDAGIDVYTTLNVQHLESINDVVAKITGIQVRETLPDAIFEQADEVELVDLAPDDLLERFREGKVYVPREAERAMQNYFSKGNLIALRELALRKAAERVGDQMEDYREANAIRGTWPARDRLLVCVGPSPFAARLVRATRRMAVSLHAPWVAVHVETPSEANLSLADKERLAETLRLAEQLGGETDSVSGHNLAEELIDYARRRNVTKIIVGKPKKPRWREWLEGSLVYDLARSCSDIDLYVISGDPEPVHRPATPRAARYAAGRGYLWSAVLIAACTGLGWLLKDVVASTNLIMVYLLAVVAVALRNGRGPAILASVLGVAAFDFFFIPPHLTFAVEDTQYLFTFAVMLITAIVIGTLTAQVKFQAESARKREHRTAALYAISRLLAATQGRDQIARAAVKQVAEAMEARVIVLVSNSERLLVPLGTEAGGFEPGPHDQAVAQWVFDHGQTAGLGTGTLPGANGIYLPLIASHGTVGVLGVVPDTPHRLDGPGQLHLLETFAGLIALSIERADLANEAERIRLQMETERLRNSLLSAVSHDLRTPLSVITGAASTLLENDTQLEGNVRRELLTSVLGESERLNRLVANLLDMTRLEAGALEVHKEWQSLEEILGAAIGRLACTLKDHRIAANLPPDLPLVPMDELLIQQVLINLLENAAKYAPLDSTIDITGSAENGFLTVDVADRGPGLPVKDVQRVFEKFYRTPDSAGRPGAGLGLAICRGIVQLHGGRIEAMNRSGGGAIFRFLLPLGKTTPSLPAVY